MKWRHQTYQLASDDICIPVAVRFYEKPKIYEQLVFDTLKDLRIELKGGNIDSAVDSSRGEFFEGYDKDGNDVTSQIVKVISYVANLNKYDVKDKSKHLIDINSVPENQVEEGRPKNQVEEGATENQQSNRCMQSYQ